MSFNKFNFWNIYFNINYALYYALFEFDIKFNYFFRLYKYKQVAINVNYIHMLFLYLEYYEIWIKNFCYFYI